MTQRWFLADLRTGRQIQDIRPTAGSYKRALNEPEDLSVTLNLRDPKTVALGLRNTAAVGKSVLAVAEGDTILAAGPIWAHTWSHDSDELKLTAKGALSYYNYRFILPVLAASLPVADFTIPDPLEPTRTIPNPALTTALTGYELGTIAKRLLEQAHTWTGGSIPVVFEADRVAPADEAHTRTYIGAEFKNVSEAIVDLTEVIGGPDIRLRPRYTADRLGIEWLLETGTEAAPLLASDTVHRWTLTLPKSAASGLEIKTDASRMAGLAWGTGGRQADEVLVARSFDATLTDAGYPLLEMLDSSHSSVSVQQTLDGYVQEATLRGRRPMEVWSFDAEAYRRPYVATYLEGDWCDLDLPAYVPASQGRARQGDPYLLNGGTFRHRILTIGGSLGSDLVKVECMERIGG